MAATTAVAWVLVGALDPEPGPARDLLRRELSGSDYRPSLLDQARDYVFGLIDRAQNALADAGAFSLTTLLVVAALLVLALLWLLARLRPETRARTSPAVLEDSSVDAAGHRRRARAALDAGAWDDAVVEGLRGIARDLEERARRSGATAGDVRPGSTAREVVGVARARFGSRASDLDAVGRSFEDVVYGDRRATERDARRAVESAEAIATATDDGSTTAAPVAAVPR